MIIHILGFLALSNAVNLRRLLAQEEEVALGGGWSESHDLTEDELSVWYQTLTKHSDGYQGIDFAALGKPVSVTTQSVAGTNYKFIFEDGSTTTVYECLWENILDVTDVSVAEKDPTEEHVGGNDGVGPVWTYDDSVEKPAGTKDMGGWTAQVYTPDQQQRLEVDEGGTPVKKSIVGDSSGSIGPEWTWNSKVEPPVGVKDMGTWKKAVYTEDQQQRLFVDEDGSPLKITDILLNRWGTGDSEPVMLGGDDHDLQPHTNLIGGGDHDLQPHANLIGGGDHDLQAHKQHLLGEGGHGLGPEYTRNGNLLGGDGHDMQPHTDLLGGDDHDKQPHEHLVGEDSHGLGPEYTRNRNLLGGDGHDMQPHTNLLGGDDHDKQPHEHLVGEDGHGLGPEYTRNGNLLGGDGHDMQPHTDLGGDDHDKQPHGSLGANGHGLGPEYTRAGNVLGGDDHDKQPHGLLGANGHGLGPKWTRGGLVLGNSREGPKWTYDQKMEKPAGEKDMGSYAMKVYTPEQQQRLGVNEGGEAFSDEVILKKAHVQNTFKNFFSRHNKKVVV